MTIGEGMDPRISKPGSGARHGVLLCAALLAVLLGGCSFERAFCGGSALHCEAEVSYTSPG